MIELTIQARNSAKGHVAPDFSLAAVEASLACASSRHCDGQVKYEDEATAVRVVEIEKKNREPLIT